MVTIQYSDLKLHTRITFKGAPGIIGGVGTNRSGDNCVLFIADNEDQDKFHHGDQITYENDIRKTDKSIKGKRCYNIHGSSYLRDVKLLDESKEQEVW
jgi:hypothetical protein